MKTWIAIVLLTMVGGLAVEPAADPTPPDIKADISKVRIESSAERLVQATRVPPPSQRREEDAEPESESTRAHAPVDRSKIAIESGAESLVKTSGAAKPTSDLADTPAAPAAPPTVITVEPGLVNWHKDYATAQAAARVSGKPILLFQLLGKLDEHFT